MEWLVVLVAVLIAVALVAALARRDVRRGSRGEEEAMPERGPRYYDIAAGDRTDDGGDASP